MSVQGAAIHEKTSAAARASFAQRPQRRSDDGANREYETSADLVNVLVFGDHRNRVREGESHHSPANVLDTDKVANDDIGDSGRFDDGIARKHRSNPSLQNKTTPTRTSCAGKGVSAIRRNRSVAYRPALKPSLNAQRKPRARQPGEALRGGKA